MALAIPFSLMELTSFSVVKVNVSEGWEDRSEHLSALLLHDVGDGDNSLDTAVYYGVLPLQFITRLMNIAFVLFASAQ